jgi:two-component system, response regulator PdtaR
MTSVLVSRLAGSAESSLIDDLRAAGMQVMGVLEGCDILGQEVVRHAPDVVIAQLSGKPDPADKAFFEATRALAETAPCPVLVFASAGHPQQIADAAEAGIHCYVADGYAASRLVSLVQMAQARFEHERSLHDSLAEMSRLLEERKVVDRAKVLLMRTRQLSDEDAFRVLRTASMHSNQRLGKVSQNIIRSALFAGAVNRAGQLRMLSQRLVKLYLIGLSGKSMQQHGERLHESVQRIDANLLWLADNLSRPVLGDRLEGIGTTWTRLKQALAAQPPARLMGPVDALAEQLLAQAEVLTAGLQGAGAVAQLDVLNTAGRQRMLSQRFCKYALLGVLGGPALHAGSVAAMAESRQAFDTAQHYLNNLPLTTPDIRKLLGTAKSGWAQVLAGAADIRLASARNELADASEALLDVFEQLSMAYESSMQMLMG